MTLLVRYLARQNLFLLFVILLVGTGIYLLTDLFEKIDDFIESSQGLLTILLFFSLKIPIIISQILPAVFLLASVIQLNLLARSNETVALQAGGISPLVIMRFLLVYGLFWACMQLFFSQYVGVEADRYAMTIWREQVKGEAERQARVRGLWFTEGNYVVHLDLANAKQGTGRGFTAYELADNGLSINTIIKAESFAILDDVWRLKKGIIGEPKKFGRRAFEVYDIPLQQDLNSFALVESTRNLAQLSIWELTAAIQRLQSAGSNVEGLRVAWHGKLAYAASIVVVGLFALAISQATVNIYKATGWSLLVIFVIYSVNTFCASLGGKGVLDPAVSAWIANITGFFVALVWLLWPNIRQRIQG